MRAVAVSADRRAARPGMLSRARPPWLAPAASAAALAAGCALLALVDPREEGSYPRCPFFAMTGRFCPGCGTLRAANRALNGDISAAFAFNPLAVLVAPLVGYAYGRWVLRRLGRGEGLPPATLGRWGSLAVAVVVPAYWVARNLPGFAFLAP